MQINTTGARFHVVVRTQTNKSVLYFTVRRNVKFWCFECYPCAKFHVKLGLRPDFTSQLELKLTSPLFILSQGTM